MTVVPPLQHRPADAIDPASVPTHTLPTGAQKFP